jgi:hypothetical protein
VTAPRETPAVMGGDRPLDAVAEQVVGAVEGDQWPPLGGGVTGAGFVYVYEVVVGV